MAKQMKYFKIKKNKKKKKERKKNQCKLQCKPQGYSTCYLVSFLP